MNFAQRLMKDSTDSAKHKLYEKQNEHNWHNCNTRQDTNWRFQYPSTEVNYVWKKWGIYFGVPKHQCYSKKLLAKEETGEDKQTIKRTIHELQSRLNHLYQLIARP